MGNMVERLAPIKGRARDEPAGRLCCLQFDAQLPREVLGASKRAAAPNGDPCRHVSGPTRGPDAVGHG
eukprot:6106189-Lingulodinium_polyedra.AAC.1